MNEIKCPKCGEIFKLDGSGYAEILQQVRDQQFEAEIQKQKETAVKLAVEQERNSAAINLNKLQELLHKIETDNALLKADKDQEIISLKAKIQQADLEKELSVKTAVDELVNKNNALIQTIQNKEADELKLRSVYEQRLNEKDEEIERYKDFRIKQNTKNIGESLEQWCLNEFNKFRTVAFKDAYFEKDNEVIDKTKGDFIFRDPAQGVELLSVMFEMKNESEESEKKQKNESFFAKLDKDRKNKNCEYAVLVTTLEEDNEAYNQGILDVSYKYPKMYVVRPQFFIPLLTILKSNADKSREIRNELALAKNQNIDITNFEDKLNKWKASWDTTIKNAGNKHQEAIQNIDKAIADLVKTREALVMSDKHLTTAESKLEDLTIKKLTVNNPTMQAKFAEKDRED